MCKVPFAMESNVFSGLGDLEVDIIGGSIIQHITLVFLI